MNKNMMNNIGLLGIIVLMITMLIACDSESGGGDTTPVGTSNLYAWGENTNGQLGNGNTTNSTTPVAIGTKTWKLISAGSGLTMAIDNNNHLYAWGWNNYGQLGIGIETVDGNEVLVSKNKPVKVGDKTWNQVSAGSGLTMAIDNNNHLYAWGLNNNGQLGIGTETVDGNEVLVSKNKPVKVGDKTWNQVSVGNQHTVAIDSADKLYVWGSTYDSDSNGNTIYQDTPVPIETTKTWKQVSAGGSINPNNGLPTGFTIAIDSNDRLYAWGANDYGQFGNGSTTGSTSPVAIGTKTWKLVSAGSGVGYTVAIDTDDHLFTWGHNGNGQLGNGNTTDSTTPVAIEPNKTWTQISTGVSHSIAIDSDGHLYAWGENRKGQLGDGNGGSVGDKSTTPVAIGTKTWKLVSAGGNHTLGIIQ